MKYAFDGWYRGIRVDMSLLIGTIFFNNRVNP